MKHLDLFSGIGGFALAVEKVWPNAEHVFCEIDPFCQQVLRKHWPAAQIFGDIRTLTHARSSKQRGVSSSERQEVSSTGRIDLLTGGFPCQPFSTAGKQRGKEDDRYLWPEMLRIIRETNPTWIVGENVAGIINMALDQVCFDLENEGYEVQPFVIPACAVNAPHRRNRVWIIANRKGTELSREWTTPRKWRNEFGCGNRPITDSSSVRHKGTEQFTALDKSRHRINQLASDQAWKQNWPEVATALCGMDDGFPGRVDRLKALGNAIVPQVATEIFHAIKTVQQKSTE